MELHVEVPSGPALLSIWERGRQLSPGARAALLAGLGLERGTASILTIGERDARLRRLTMLLRGPRVELPGRCPRCGTRVDLQIPLGGLDGPAPTREGVVQHAGFTVRFRPILASDLVSARTLTPESLARRCIVAATQGSGEVPAAAVPRDVLQRVADQLSVLDPSAETLLTPSCFVCSASWSLEFDIVRLAWDSIAAAALALADDVHRIAMAYHWSEETILTMSPARRQLYLERITGAIT